MRLTASGSISWQKRLGAGRDEEALCASLVKSTLQVVFRSTSLRKDGASELGMLSLDSRGAIAGQWYFQNSRSRRTVTSYRGTSHTRRRRYNPFSEIRFIDNEGKEGWSNTLADLVEYSTFGVTGSGVYLVKARYADPAWANEGKPQYNQPLLLKA
jgi:hypothetical protein